MGNLFYGYDMRDWWDKKDDELDTEDLLVEHVKKTGYFPPSILINKNDLESIPKELGAEVDKYVLPHSILLEILEPIGEESGN